jgi:hypothetical protein
MESSTKYLNIVEPPLFGAVHENSTHEVIALIRDKPVGESGAA